MAFRRTGSGTLHRTIAGISGLPPARALYVSTAYVLFSGLDGANQNSKDRSLRFTAHVRVICGSGSRTPAWAGSETGS